jgi:hypothetical protein
MKEAGKITVNGVEYVQVVKGKTEKMIVAADRGWVFVGDCEKHKDGTMTIHNAKNIRRWGTSKGLGELTNGPTEKTVFDEYGTVKTRPILTIAVNGGW